MPGWTWGDSLVLLVCKASFEVLAVFGSGHFDQSQGTLGNGAARQHGDTVLGDDGVDVDPRGRHDPTGQSRDDGGVAGLPRTDRRS